MSETLRTVISDRAHPPHGHYSHAVVDRGIAYVSGILGNGAGAADVPPPPIDDQARFCLDQIRLILADAGSSLAQVLKLNVHVVSLSDWPAVDRRCAEAFGAHRPARVVVPCSGGLRLGSLIEMDVVAVCD